MAEDARDPLDPASRRSLDRTRGGVLNILLATGFLIAISGALLRWRAAPVELAGSTALHDTLITALLVLAVFSYTLRRVLGTRFRLENPATRASRFFWAHVLPASLAALAVPMGLVHGWLVAADLPSVAPFWVAAMALGFLALPRAHELEGFPDVPRENEAAQP